MYCFGPLLGNLRKLREVLRKFIKKYNFAEASWLAAPHCKFVILNCIKLNEYVMITLNTLVLFQ